MDRHECPRSPNLPLEEIAVPPMVHDLNPPLSHWGHRTHLPVPGVTLHYSGLSPTALGRNGPDSAPKGLGRVTGVSKGWTLWEVHRLGETPTLHSSLLSGSTVGYTDY